MYKGISHRTDCDCWHCREIQELNKQAYNKTLTKADVKRWEKNYKVVEKNQKKLTAYRIWESTPPHMRTGRNGPWTEKPEAPDAPQGTSGKEAKPSGSEKQNSWESSSSQESSLNPGSRYVFDLRPDFCPVKRSSDTMYGTSGSHSSKKSSSSQVGSSESDSDKKSGSSGFGRSHTVSGSWSSGFGSSSGNDSFGQNSWTSSAFGNSWSSGFGASGSGSSWF